MFRYLVVLAVIIVSLSGSAECARHRVTRANIKFRLAENKYGMGEYTEAKERFKKVLPITTDRNKIDAISIRVADCLYALDQKDKAIRIYKNVFMDKRYSLLKTVAFWKWRTAYQLTYHGTDPDSAIPAKLYRKHKVRLYNMLKTYSIRNPLSDSSQSQMAFLRQLHNVAYDAEKGSTVEKDFAILYFKHNKTKQKAR
ncbi:tol-pal system YbgF family protein [Candidatus Auribacterota bacterium]